MYIKIYETVKDRDIIAKAIDFGLRVIDIKPNPYYDLDRVSIRVYSIGHPTSKGLASMYSGSVRIQVFTGSNDNLNGVIKTIFHELAHLKQFSLKVMQDDEKSVIVDEALADLYAESLLVKFLNDKG